MPTIPDSRILIVATDGFEEWELFGPREILQKRGAEVVLASPKRDPIQATVHDDPGKTIRPDLTVDEALADDFDALILPGGVRNPDHLRTNVRVIQLIKDFAEQGKPVGAICHGPWTLINAGVVRGREGQDLLPPGGIGRQVHIEAEAAQRLERREVPEPDGGDAGVVERQRRRDGCLAE